jgi:16S rRNA (guanine527-N7)-methyltransferase
VKHPEQRSDSAPEYRHNARPDSSLDPDDARALERAYGEAVRLGFLGPREQERLWERHFDDALGLATIRSPRPDERWVDLGSGAGLPGLPLALAHRSTSFTLVDAQRKRLDWVATIAADLGLTNLAVVHARLEEYAHGPARESFDGATARALGTLPVVAELGLPLLKTGGLLLVPRGQPDTDEVEQAAIACELLGGRIRDVVPNPSSPIDRVGFVVIMAKIAATSPRFPRRSGVPTRSPLGQWRKQ